MSSWTRTIVVPLSIFSAFKPVRQLPPERGIARAVPATDPTRRAGRAPPTQRLAHAGRNFFLGVDWLLQVARALAAAPSARPAPCAQAARVDARALRGQRRPRRDLPADDLHGHRPAAAWATPTTTPEMQLGAEAARRPDDRGGRHAPAAAVLLAGLGHGARARSRWPTRGAGRRDDPAMRARRVALAARQGSAPAGRLERRRSPGVEPGGWFFEYRNGFYPDIDDTAMVLMAPGAHGAGRRVRERAAGRRSAASTGCWRCRTATAAGRRSTATSTTSADQGPVRRPQRDARPELPGHHRPRPRGAGPLRLSRRPPAVDRGARVHLDGRRSRDGCWFGRWGVNYIYGTWQVLRRPAGDRLRHGRTRWSAGRSRWLEGGAASRRRLGRDLPQLRRPDAGRARATPTASQTAWALLGLIAAGEADSAAVARAASTTCVGTQRRRRQLGRGAVHRHRLPEVST